MADGPEDLRDRLDAAYAAADRLVQEAARQAQQANPGDVPPRGWDAPREERADPFAFPELDSLRGLLDLARGAVPADLQRQLAEALRELLLALRALIDWYLERLERTGGEAAEVEDIPIQ